MKKYQKNIKEFETLMTSPFIKKLIQRSYKRKNKNNVPVSLAILIKKNKRRIKNAE